MRRTFRARRRGYPGLSAPAASAAGRRAGLAAHHQRFHLANIQALVHDLLGQRLGIVVPDQRARMASAERAVAHQRLHAFRQLQKPHGVGEMAAALADDLAKFVLRVVELSISWR